MFADFLERMSDILQYPLITLAGTTITLATVILLIGGSVLFVYLTKYVHRWIVDKLLVKTSMDIGNREATGNIIRYVILVLGIIVIFQILGIDLTIFNILAGTLGIGVGFGLQNIVNNFAVDLSSYLNIP